MGDFTFAEWLILILIGLLFAKDYILVPILKKLGIANGKNGSIYQKQIDELHGHADTANKEMGEIKRDISTIKADISFIRGKIEK